VLIPGFIGARLYYVFIQSPRGEGGLISYLENPGSILQVWQGGIHIFGGFIFGAIALFLYTRIKRLPTLVFLDAIALALPLAQAIGRWGNFINQELYGPPTTLPWGLRIDPQHRIPPYNDLTTYPDSTRFQPLFLYESLWNFLGFGILFWISRRFKPQLKDGDLTLLYLIWYPLGRFFIEFLRTDSWFFPGTPFNVVHILSAIAVLASAVWLFVRHRKKERISDKG
jgi:phosphatidylglycerol---prolipoprotein diacylglyceryl transferase